MKKVITLLLSLAMAFAFVTGIGGSGGAAIVSEAAAAKYLPYYYNRLSDSRKSNYIKLRNAILNHESSITINKVIDEDESMLYFIMFYWYDTQTFNVEDMSTTVYSTKTVFRFKYRYSKANADKITELMNKKADKIISHFDEDTTTYAKLLYIHDYLIKNTDYVTDTATCDIAYGALIKGKAKCDGYAKAFTYVCGRAGITSINVVGEAEEGHMWNKVKYGKKWYNIDLTWDDPTNNMINNLNRSYFMIDDETIYRTHTCSNKFNVYFDIPAATDESKTYYKLYKQYIGNSDDTEKVLRAVMKKAAKAGKCLIEMQCSDEKNYLEAIDNIYDNNGAIVFKAIEDINKNYKTDIYEDYCQIIKSDDTYVITVLIFYNDTNLDDYFIDTAQVADDVRSALKDGGIAA